MDVRAQQLRHWIDAGVLSAARSLDRLGLIDRGNCCAPTAFHMIEHAGQDDSLSRQDDLLAGHMIEPAGHMIEPSAHMIEPSARAD